MMNPKSNIVVFACNWCSPTAVDFEVLENNSSANIFIIRLMCAGSFHSSFAIKVFELGADGVLIIGCQKEECHYGFGNNKVYEQVGVAQNLLALLGSGTNRIKLELIPKEVQPQDMNIFMDKINKFVGDIKRL